MWFLFVTCTDCSDLDLIMDVINKHKDDTWYHEGNILYKCLKMWPS